MSSININSVPNTASVTGVTSVNSNGTGINSVNNLSSIDKYETKYKLRHISDSEQDFTKQSNVNAAIESNPKIDAVKAVSGALKKAADSITSRFPPIFEQLAASLDNNDVLTVSNVNSFSVSEETTEVNVAQTAEAQQNTGKELNSENMDFEKGSNRFKIKTERGDYNFNINVSDNDTNRSVLQKTADSINRRDIGVNAQVSYNKDSRNSSLVVESKNTGSENAFTIEDTEGGSFVDKLGVNNASKEARDAKYSVNNGDYKNSSSNEVYIGNGISAELKSIGSVTINLSKDTNKIEEQVSEFVNGFNDFLKSAKEDLNSNKLTSQLKSAFNTYSGELEKSGISYGSEGLKTDQNTLRSSIETNELEKALVNSQSSSESFTDKISRIARNVQADPLKFTDSNNEPKEFNESSVTGKGLLFNSFV